MPGTLLLSSQIAPSVALLAQTLFNALDQVKVFAPSGWWFSPDGLDFTAVGGIQIDVLGANAQVTIKFLGPHAPSLVGVLDLALLEGLLTSTPNALDSTNANPQGPAASVLFTSNESDASSPSGAQLSLTKTKSGRVFVAGEMLVTQAAQGVVTFSLYADFGTPGQKLLASAGGVPGGLSPFDTSAHLSGFFVLPDALPHVFSIQASGAGLSLAAGAAALQAWEIGGPG